MLLRPRREFYHHRRGEAKKHHLRSIDGCVALSHIVTEGFETPCGARELCLIMGV